VRKTLKIEGFSRFCEVGDLEKFFQEIKNHAHH